MRDLISRQAAINAFEPDHPVDWYTTMIVDVLEDLPSAEPERKKGKWIYSSPNGFKCSECGGYLEIGFGTVKMNFCPNCGSYNGGR